MGSRSAETSAGQGDNRLGRRVGTAAAIGALALSALAVGGGAQTALAGTTPDGQAPTTAAYASINPVTPLTASTFADPSTSEKPWVRWNFKPADPLTTTASLEADLEDAAAHNIGGVEIGQGGVPTTAQLTTIYAKAKQLGITVSLKAAAALPGQSYANTDAYARRTLNFSRFDPVTAGATVDADLPGTATGTVVAVVAYRCTTAGCPNLTGGQVSLVRDSAVDLTSTLTATNTSGYQGGTTAGHLSWTAPTTTPGASWLVTVYRAVPFGTTPETLSTQGTQEVTDAYDAYFAGGLGDLVKENAGDFFVDSHAGDPWGVPQELWSSNMKTDFAASTGYDIVPLLGALVDTSMQSGLTTTYTFSDGSAARIRSDFSKVRSDLYTTNRIEQFQTWAHTYNMKLRLQQEDTPTTAGGDQIQTSVALDRSEHESLIGSDQTDTYRSMASANHMTGNTWFSTECCAVLNEAYAQTTEDLVVRMNREFAGGVTRLVYHTRPSTATSTSSWPGPNYSGGDAKTGFSNSYTSVQPYYTDAAAYNDYFARTTTVLTQGAAKVDVAVYNRNYSNPAAFGITDPSNKHWQDTGLQRAGYTWDYADDTTLDLPNATVTNGRLAADGPAYQALVFDQFLLPTASTTRGTLTVGAAQKMLDYAEAGLPIIFVGNPQNSGTYPATTDTDLNAVLAQLRAQPTFSSVPSEAAVPGKLKQLGLLPAAQTKDASSVLSVRRRDASTGTNYYWLYNQGVDAYAGNNALYGQNPSNLYEDPDVCHTTGSILNPCMATGNAVDTTVTLEGAGIPVLLDTWSGEITPISEYSRAGDRVTVKLHLERDASTVIALTTSPGTFGVTAPTAYVDSTTADGVSTTGSNVFIKASANGHYVTTLGGTSSPIVSTVTDVPAAVDLTRSTWALDVEDWKPANAYGTTGAAGSETTKSVVSVTANGLKPWSDIPELSDASGVGTYTTTVNLPSDWKPTALGATIDLGQVTDSFRLSVNGHDVPVDQVSGQADLGAVLHAGANTVVVRVATTLNNRLYQLDTGIKNRGLTQEYGLVGPVTLSPYRLVQVNAVKPGTTALRSTAKPRLLGTAKIGKVLTATPGTWTPAATSYVFTWKRNGSVIKAVHGKKYRLRRADAGKRITVTVTASRSGYASASATSPAKKVKAVKKKHKK
ncbi:hypothetical protein ASC77_05355 [Nocardioides sp. Root1257]|nr:hypothetical protein ASC77_05355 [Nocardioides sp. Root1257]KRC56380.1 hypothetical protein ASE24_05355 [Nocardioides sp. Root224]